MSEMYFNGLFWMLYNDYELLKKKNGGFIKENGHLRLNSNLIPDDLRRKLKAAEWLRYYSPEAPRGVNIFEESGVKIAFGGAAPESYGHPEDKNAARFLKLDQIYTIKTTIPYEWITYVELQEFPGVTFSLFSFYPTGYSIKTIEQLIEDYGPEFDQDYQKLLKIIEEYENRPKPTELEKLRSLRDEIKENGPGFYQIMDSVKEYWNVKSGERPLFEAGMKFNDSSRYIEILCASTTIDLDPVGSWRYFCKITEHNNGLVDYYVFDEADIRLIHLADINCSAENLSEKELLIKEIFNLCGGIYNMNNLCFPEGEKAIVCVDTPEYFVGYEEVQKDGSTWKVLMVSPTPNCFGEWMYFGEVIKKETKI